MIVLEFFAIMFLLPIAVRLAWLWLHVATFLVSLVLVYAMGSALFNAIWG